MPATTNTRTELEQIVEAGPKLRPRTKQLYLHGVKAFLDHAGFNPTRWTMAAVEDWRNSMLETGVKPQTVNVNLHALRYAARRYAEQHRDGTLDFTREDEDLRRFFSSTLGEVLAHRLKAFSPPERPLSEEDVMDFLSTLVGAIILARATRGTALSDRWMQVIKAKLKSRFVYENRKGAAS